MKGSAIYIAIEGLDGTGKSTLFNNLCDKLDAANISYSTLCPTRMTRPRSLIERMYNFNNWHKRILWFRRLIYAYRSYCAVKSLNTDVDIILGDRSIAGTYAKSWKVLFGSRSLTVAFFNLAEPFIAAPDYILLLQAPMQVIHTRLQGRAYIDADESEASLLKMKDAYAEISGSYTIHRLRNSQWIPVDADKEQDVLTDEVLAMIHKWRNTDS